MRDTRVGPGKAQGYSNPWLTWSHGVGEGWARVLAEMGYRIRTQASAEVNGHSAVGPAGPLGPHLLLQEALPHTEGLSWGPASHLNLQIWVSEVEGQGLKSSRASGGQVRADSGKSGLGPRSEEQSVLDQTSSQQCPRVRGVSRTFFPEESEAPPRPVCSVCCSWWGGGVPLSALGCGVTPRPTVQAPSPCGRNWLSWGPAVTPGTLTRGPVASLFRAPEGPRPAP